MTGVSLAFDRAPTDSEAYVLHAAKSQVLR